MKPYVSDFLYKTILELFSVADVSDRTEMDFPPEERFISRSYKFVIPNSAKEKRITYVDPRTFEVRENVLCLVRQYGAVRGYIDGQVFVLYKCSVHEQVLKVLE